MDSIFNPRNVSGVLQVIKTEDSGDNSVRVELSGQVSKDFQSFWNDDPRRIINAKVNAAVLGLSVDLDTENLEFQNTGKSQWGRMVVEGTVKRMEEGITVKPLSKTLIVPDTQLVKVVLVEEEARIVGEERARLITSIHEKYHETHDIVEDPDAQKFQKEIWGEKSADFSLRKLSWIASLRNQGIDVEDLQRYLCGLRLGRILDAIIKKEIPEGNLKTNLDKGKSLILSIPGFTQPDAVGVFEDTDDAELIGTRVIFPRQEPETYQSTFSMRIKARRKLCLQTLRIPLSFYRLNNPKKSSQIGKRAQEPDLRKRLEHIAKVDLELVPSYPATHMIFELLKEAQGGRKAMIIRNQKDYEGAICGDGSMVVSHNEVIAVYKAHDMALAENGEQPEEVRTISPSSFPELKIVQKIPNGENGILFCKYFPDTDVLRRLHEHAHKLRAIVFQAPSYDKSENVLRQDQENFPMEAHIFFGSDDMVALRVFHKKYPTVKIIWSHPGLQRNLVFVDDSKLPMFAKPEVAEYLLHDDIGVRVSFCGSSTAKSGMSESEKTREMEREKAFTSMYNDYAKEKGKRLVGINGGGPDVMERNGAQLQGMGAVSVASACDLGKAKQTRHNHWDAVLDQKGDEISFAMREQILLSGEIVHIAPGGIGSLQEVLGILAQNKIGNAKRRLILQNREYWRGIIDQLIEAARNNNVGAKALCYLYLADTPEQAKQFLCDAETKDFEKKREETWNKVVKGEEGIEILYS